VYDFIRKRTFYFTNIAAKKTLVCAFRKCCLVCQVFISTCLPQTSSANFNLFTRKSKTYWPKLIFYFSVASWLTLVESATSGPDNMGIFQIFCSLFAWARIFIPASNAPHYQKEFQRKWKRQLGHGQ